MKKIKGISIGVVLVLIISILNSCSKDVDDQFNIDHSKIQFDIKQQNAALEELGSLVSKALGDAKVRILIKELALKKYNGQYDIPFEYLIAGTAFQKSENHFTRKIMENILGNTDDEKLNKLKDLISIIPTLQLSVPVHCDEWDAENYHPLIAILKMDHGDMIDKFVMAIDAHGKTIELDAINEPSLPVVVIGKGERVDENGNVMYDRNGFQIKPEERISALLAVDNPELIIDNGFRLKIVESFEDVANQGSNIQLNKNKMSLVADPIDCALLEKAMNLAFTTVPDRPTNVKVINAGFVRSLEVSWSYVSNATYYKIYRTTQASNDIVYIGQSTSNRFVDHGVGFFGGLPVINQTYIYYVTGVNSLGESGYSAFVPLETEDYAAYRENQGKEQLSYLYMTSAMFNSLEGWTNGNDLEIQIKISSTYKDSNNSWQIMNHNLFSGNYAIFTERGLSGKNRFVTLEIFAPFWDYRTRSSIYTITSVVGT